MTLGEKGLQLQRLVGRFRLLGVLLAHSMSCLKCEEVSMRCKVTK